MTFATCSHVYSSKDRKKEEKQQQQQIPKLTLSLFWGTCQTMPGPDAGMHRCAANEAFVPGIFLHFLKFQSGKVILSISTFKTIHFVARPGLGLESIVYCPQQNLLREMLFGNIHSEKASCLVNERMAKPSLGVLCF